MEINGVRFIKFVNAIFFDGSTVFSPQGESTYGVLESKMDQVKIQDKLFAFFNVKTKGADVESDKLGKMFFSKTATVPRYKIREVKDKYNLSVVRDSTKADTIVISKNEVLGNTSYSWGQYIYKREDVTKVLESCLSPTISGNTLKLMRPYRYSSSVVNTVDNKEEVQKAVDAIKALPADIEYISFSYGYKDKFDSVADALGYTDAKINSNIHVVDQAVVDNLRNYADKTIITDSALQSILGSSDMEHENYVFIDQLLSSSDPGNIELGLTLMANCNFEGSQHYLLILLGDHFNNHRYNKYCHSVAFKSLLDFMNFSKYTNVNLDNILDKADSMGKLTDEIKDLVFKRAMDEFGRSFSRYKWITVKGIEIVKPENDTNQGGN
jgi:hypothetical protein